MMTEMNSTNDAQPVEEEKELSFFEQFKKRLRKPHYVRPNDYKRFEGANYIIRRNEHGSAVYVVGKAYRRLPTDLDVRMALKMDKMVAQWGSKYFLFTKTDAETGREILKRIWETELKRGIPVPDVSDYDKENFDI